MTPRLRPRRTLKNCTILQLPGLRRQSQLYPMLPRSASSGSKSWPNDSTRFLPLLAVHTYFIFFSLLMILSLYSIDNAFSFLLTFPCLSIQSVPRLFCQLRNLPMILFWQRSTCSKQTGYLSRMFSSWLATFYRGCLSGYGRRKGQRFQSAT